jgi:TolB-like protein/DNA-binding winged helix-turn-helix (wHTH) protein
MASPGQPAPAYKFGVFVVDTRSGELRKGGVRVKLQERPFRLLVALVAKPGHLVTREELRQSLWPEGTFVDFDHNISSSINKLRGALNDSPTHPRYIETVGRRGYRFLADVKPVAPNGAAVEPAPELKAIAAAPSGTRWRVWRPWLAAVGIATVLTMAFTGYRQWTHSRTSSQQGTRTMLAVLPFENLTGDPGQEYFGDGLTEEMIAQLGRMDPQHLGVIARTSIMHYKHSQASLEQIAHELSVQYVLEGSIRRDSEKVRIAAQLIQVKDQTHLWAREYDRELKDVLPVQGEIAREIADEIQGSLGHHLPAVSIQQSSLSPQALEAYNLYLKGLYFWNKRTVAGFQEAISYFQQATEKDRNFARAYAGLADAYALIAGYSGVPQVEYAPKARAAALRALEIDANLPEAHTALALIVENYDWDWQTAEKEYRRAIELDPNYATAHHWYAEYLMWQGRFSEALVESERARQLDPLSLIIAADNGAILFFSRQYDRAIEQFRSVREMDPAFPRAGLLGSAYVQKGMLVEAMKLNVPAADSPYYWSQEAYLYGRMGRLADAKHSLNSLFTLNRRQPADAALVARAYLGVDNKELALLWLEKAYAQRSYSMTALKVDPIYDPLRNEPRFQELLRRVGLAQ